MKKAALYVRVSTLHQVDKDSLPFQRQELENYAKYALNIEDVEIFEDAGYSAKNTDRPRYQQMMQRIRNGEFTHLLVWKIDRISRNLKDFSEMYEELKNYKVTFVSKNEQFDTSSAMGEAMLKIILVFAELERKLTAERVFSIMLSRAEKGLWNGATVPIGYVWSDEAKFPVVDQEEAAIVHYIYDIYEKIASTSKVAFRLNNEQVKTKRGGKWTAKTVRDILRNPFYIGTYRYNIRKSEGSRRLKNKEEWIVVEDNHTPIISKEQYHRVNKMLTDNYKGIGDAQRANIHTHVFSRMLYCGKCDMLLTAGLDAARKDGYRPSRYTCSTNKLTENTHNCNNFVSDITLIPFVLNYVSNLIRLQDKVTPKHALKDIERMLLRGSAFVDVLGINREALQDTHLMFIEGFNAQPYALESENEPSHSSLAIDQIIKEKQKFEKALGRLEDLFLFSEEAMSEKDYIFKKRELLSKVEKLNEELNNKYQESSSSGMDKSFLNNAKHFLITQELFHSRDIDYRELLDIVGKEMITDFIQSVISKIIVTDKKIRSITFKNGIKHNFAYKPLQDRKSNNREKFLYQSYEEIVLIHLKEHGSANRTELENLTNMKRSSTLALLHEMMEKGLIVKRGNSVAIRYYINKIKD
ncbi:recombinase family protein [Lysinibacillus sp. NPDC097162]|uniref:recombinase family protein n=1 Tax=Lysinibacillus sp. NPDC097162 TaxID=3364140 RepID=UPI003806E09B